MKTNIINQERRRIIIDFEVLSKTGFWMCCMKDFKTGKEHTIINDKDEFLRVFNKNKESIWVGYNIKGYDQWLIKGLIAGIDPCTISSKLIDDKVPGWSIHPSLNKVKLFIFELSDSYRSLKELELFMGEDIQESSVSFDLETYPTKEEIEELTSYCLHDVRMTTKVFEESYHKYEAQLGLIDYFDLDPIMFNKTEAQLSAHILGAEKPSFERYDTFNFDIVDTIKLSKYSYVKDWYLNPANKDFKHSLRAEIYGVQTDFGWGGLHSARKKYKAEGFIVNSDVSSFYPAIMIEYNLLSRNVEDSNKFKEIRDTRIKFKREK